jgi:hypothetical protein
MDFAIEGVDVDCKYAQSIGEWMIPPEAVGHIILGLWASDELGRWSLGLIRVTEQVLTSSRGNRDLKRRLTAAGKREVAWIIRDQMLPENARCGSPPRMLSASSSPGTGPNAWTCSSGSRSAA